MAARAEGEAQTLIQRFAKSPPSQGAAFGVAVVARTLLKKETAPAPSGETR